MRRSTIATNAQRQRQELDQRLGPTAAEMCAKLNIDPAKFDAFRERLRGEGRAALSAGRALTTTERMAMDPDELTAAGEVGFAKLVMAF